MDVDEHFPLEAVPSGLRTAILTEFQGRRPSIEEVAQIPVRQWLSTPNVGQRSVEIIRDITGAARQQKTRPCARLTDAELLGCLEWLQKETRLLQKILKGRILGK
jgi:hypothetical protein